MISDHSITNLPIRSLRVHGSSTSMQRLLIIIHSPSNSYRPGLPPVAPRIQTFSPFHGMRAGVFMNMAIHFIQRVSVYDQRRPMWIHLRCVFVRMLRGLTIPRPRAKLVYSDIAVVRMLQKRIRRHPYHFLCDLVQIIDLE